MVGTQPLLSCPYLEASLRLLGCKIFWTSAYLLAYCMSLVLSLPTHIALCSLLSSDLEHIPF